MLRRDVFEKLAAPFFQTLPESADAVAPEKTCYFASG